MARLAKLSRDEEEHDDISDTDGMPSQRSTLHNAVSLSPSSSVSFSSDKENRTAILPSRTFKAQVVSMAPPTLPTPRSSDPDSERASKRRRLTERDAPAANPSQTAHARLLANLDDKDFYDPEQDIDQRRKIRKDYRDLSKDLTDSKTEFLASESTGLYRTVSKANDLYGEVRQTSDATLDSRLLVSAADLSAKRTEQLQLGDATQGIDIDDFVGRCIIFMRRGDSAQGSQRRQRRQGYDEDDDADEGDGFNWSYMGAALCIPHNVRPPTPGFLLGPLSVQKKARKQTQRTQRLQKRDPNEAVRPEELKVKDVEKNESNSLTTICTQIRSLLQKTQNEGSQKVEAEVTNDMGEEEIAALCTKWNVCTDGGVPLFNFVVNPHSFGQTVENLFYISFLIRDGTCGIGQVDGQPTLRKSSCPMMMSLLPITSYQEHILTRYADATNASSKEELNEQNKQKHQAVFHLDHPTWEDLISAFEIKRSIIPHREPDEEVRDGHAGWK